MINYESDQVQNFTREHNSGFDSSIISDRLDKHLFEVLKCLFNLYLFYYLNITIRACNHLLY